MQLSCERTQNEGLKILTITSFLIPFMTNPEPNTIAVYLDFENIHLSLCDEEGIRMESMGDRYKKQSRLVNLNKLLEFARSFGRVAISRAYADWDWLGAYRDDLNMAGFDLIQIFPKGPGGKNGADIRLSLDALEDIYRFPHINTVMVIAGDSDYIALAQKIKQTNRTIVGVGVRGTTNRFWEHNCSEFRYYHDLVASAELPKIPSLNSLATSLEGIATVSQPSNPQT
jgi:hypothetical protein